MQLNDMGGLASFVTVAGIAASSGIGFRPGRWYETLRKPGWTPPRWVFPAVWTPLYIMMAVSGWLVWRRAGFVPVPFAFYAAQLVLNGAWSGLFFGLRRPDLALADIALLWMAIVGTILGFAEVSHVAAWLLAPYLLWGTLAAGLNLSVWRLNRDRLAAA